jgi:hypothetical protein
MPAKLPPGKRREPAPFRLPGELIGKIKKIAVEKSITVSEAAEYLILRGICHERKS